MANGTCERYSYITWFNFVVVVLPMFITCVATSVGVSLYLVDKLDVISDRRISTNAQTLAIYQNDLAVMRMDFSNLRTRLGYMERFFNYGKDIDPKEKSGTGEHFGYKD
jgi:hypothetical protein